MNKKIGVLFLFLVLISGVVLAASSLGNNLDNTKKNIEDTKEKIDEAKKITEQDDSWLWGKIKDLLFKIPGVSFLDSVLTEVSPVFKLIFGEEYSSTIRFLFTVFIWVYFLFAIYSLLKYTPFLDKFPFLFSIILSLFFASLGLYSKFVSAVIGLVNFPIALFNSLGNLFSSLLSKLVWIGIILVALYFLEQFLTAISIYMKKKRGILEEEQNLRDKAMLHMIVSGLERIFGGGGNKKSSKKSGLPKSSSLKEKYSASESWEQVGGSGRKFKKT